jgi:hypothetical protein
MGDPEKARQCEMRTSTEAVGRPEVDDNIVLLFIEVRVEGEGGDIYKEVSSGRSVEKSN